MPIKNGIGYSEFTPKKIEDFSKIIAMHLAITQAVINRNPAIFPREYHYIELTAGQGYSPDGQKGSPLVFIEKAEEEKFYLPIKADFIDCESGNISELIENLKRLKTERNWTKVSWEFHCGNYQDEIKKILNTKHNNLGLVFIDPTGSPPDKTTLRHISTYRPKMDVLIYISATNVKRILKYTNLRLTDYIQETSKKFWLIRKAQKSDKHKWTFLLGSNTKLSEHKGIKLFSLESEIGQAILEDLNYTTKEKFESIQPKLFE
jgi:three-Cys-motif partner protein